MKKDLFQSLKIIIVGLVLSLGVGYLLAWTGPTGQAPTPNAPAPISTNASAQLIGSGTPLNLLQIGGILSSNSLAVFGPATITGNLKVPLISGGLNMCADIDGTVIVCPPIASPTITTSNISAITSSSATGGGNITNEGGSTIVTKGIVWGNSSNPTITNKIGITSNGAGLGSFTSSMTALLSSTTYYVRAYATNSAGITYYGSNVSFTTLMISISPPTLTTTPITNITGTTATSGGSFTGGSGVVAIQKGLQTYNLTNNTYSWIYVSPNNGSGNTTFTTNITGLTPHSVYKVRAYALFSNYAPVYGNEITFTSTPPPLPCLGWSQSYNGVTYCWYMAGLYEAGISCTALCGMRHAGATCDPRNWNDTPSCSLQAHFGLYGSCATESADRKAMPGSTNHATAPDTRRRADSVTQDCSATFPSWSRRLCACNF